jgi:hypothetical protein
MRLLPLLEEDGSVVCLVMVMVLVLDFFFKEDEHTKLHMMPPTNAVAATPTANPGNWLDIVDDLLTLFICLRDE